MFGLRHSGCHSRENGNPETKNRYPWIPASAGMTNPKKSTLNLRSLKICRKCQANLPFLGRMRLIWTAMCEFLLYKAGNAPERLQLIMRRMMLRFQIPPHALRLTVLESRLLHAFCALWFLSFPYSLRLTTHALRSFDVDITSPVVYSVHQREMGGKINLVFWSSSEG
jgi:hypothetical protein